MHTESILSFLADLKINNNREWMSSHKARYLKEKEKFNELIQAVINGISDFDPKFSEVELKECVLRINRDIRFSHDKTPYKTNFAAVIAPEGGKKSVLPCYYISLGPDGESFAAGGLYLPAGGNLKKVRQEIDYNGDELRSIISAAKFKKTFGQIEGESLKTSPRGYEQDHPHIDLLRLKSFIVRHQISNNDMNKNDFVEHILGLFKEMKPLNDFLFQALS